MKQTFSDAFKWALVYASQRILYRDGGEMFLTSWGKPSTNRCAETSSWNVSRAETGNAINYPPSVVLPVCGSCYFIRCCCSCCWYCCCCHCWFKNKHNIHSSKEKPLPSLHPFVPSQFDEEAALAVNLWNNEIYEFCSGKYDILVTLSVCADELLVGCGCVRAKSETQSSMLGPASASAAGTVCWHEYGEHTARSVGIFAKWPLKPK